MISRANYYGTLGYVTMLIKRRQQLDEWESSAADFLKGLGAQDSKDSFGSKVKDHVGEAVYNSGDDPEQAAKELLEALHLKVEDA